MDLTEKSERLNQIIRSLPPAAVAFSGGVDSSFLSSVVYGIQGESAVALTVDSIFASRAEMKEAVSVAGEIGIAHKVINLDEMDSSVLTNPSDRCYHCKKMIFGRILEYAETMGKTVLLEGSNLDDLDDYRPGLKAIQELAVKSPLLEAELTKEEIRKLSRERGLSSWNRPSMACLASRIPYRDRITAEDLQMVEQAEGFLMEKGFSHFRVRKHGSLARIEVSPGDRARFFSLSLMEMVTREFKKIGFTFVALDLEGYRTGSLNR